MDTPCLALVLCLRDAVLATLDNKGLTTRLQLICKPNASCNPNCVCPVATHKCFGAGMQVCKVRQMSGAALPANAFLVQHSARWLAFEE